MLALYGVTLATSAMDSINPIAMAQQLVLQSVVKQKRAIWGFIIGVGLTNFAAGMLVYYGIAALFKKYIAAFMTQYPMIVSIAEVLLGIFCVIMAIRMLRPVAAPKEEGVPVEDTGKLRNAGWVSLFLMGVVFCGAELTSALPYFGFLAFLLKYSLSLPAVFMVLLVYNLVYSLPLIFLYWGYNKMQDKFADKYAKVERGVAKVTSRVVPFVIVALGVFFVGHAAIGMI